MKIYTDLSEIEKIQVCSDMFVLFSVRGIRTEGLESLRSDVWEMFLRFLSRNANRLSLRNSFMLGIRLFWNQGIASVLLIIDPRTAYVFSGMEPPEQKGEKSGHG